MGQQQMLLLIIGVIVVGAATMTGFEVVQRKQQQFAVDNLLDRCLEIATHAVHWKTKNDPFFMGDAHYTRLSTNGMAMLGLSEEGVGTLFSITGATESTLEITGVSTRYEGMGVRVTVTNYEVTSTEVSYNDDISIDVE